MTHIESVIKTIEQMTRDIGSGKFSPEDIRDIEAGIRILQQEVAEYQRREREDAGETTN